ncbi:MAG TPA: hypothetical protein VI387_10170, partial [Candidatus Brocadiales bacterium]|nr:hypothetical protein [Candidatus Brocadiales bacterium]
MLLVVGVIVVLGISIFIFINYQINYEIRTNATWELFKTKSVFDEFQEIRNAQLLSDCRIIAELPMWKPALATKDHLAVLNFGQELQKIVNRDIFIVTDENGVILANATEPDKYGDTLEVSGVGDALIGHEYVATLVLPSLLRRAELYQAAFCPVRLGEDRAVAGVVMLGLLI